MDNSQKNKFLHPDEETIVAQCTPKGSGALALIRMSGKNAIETATKMSKLTSKEKLSEVTTHTIHYGSVIDKNDKKIDQVLFLVMRAPKTFTGQDTLEITCHNNKFIIENIIQEAIKHGARLAQNGEFTRRAFLNGKVDLVQAESINELIHAQTQMAIKSSLCQLEGSLSCWSQKIEKDLVKALALSEASFEFLDEENMEFSKQIKQILEKSINTIHSLKKTFNLQKQIKEGLRIAIIGSVNAGKSSLFNALLAQDRAIVTEIEGTTRDSIEAGIYTNGNFITLVDTAGIRKTNDYIEKEGIQRSLDEAKKADIVVVVYDGSKTINEEEKNVYQNIIDSYKQKIIIVRNKIDVTPNSKKQFQPHGQIDVSTIKKINIDLLENQINKKISDLFSSIESPYLLNQRQYSLIAGLENKLQHICSMLQNDAQYELISYHLKEALQQFSELSGKTISEQSLDTVFKEFCIGK